MTAAARLAAIAGCLAYAALALASGLDRMAASRHRAPPLPGLIAADALVWMGGDAVAARKPAEARELAVRAINRAPVDPSSATLLGAALAISGDEPGAERAFRVARQMGWRVPLTQIYWMQHALVHGNAPEAARRLDALLRFRPDLVHDAKLTGPVTATPRGRRAFAARLALPSVWTAAYASEWGDLPRDELARRSLVLDDLARSGHRLGCAPLRAAVSTLVSAGDPLRAASLWRTHCPNAARGFPADGDLAGLTLAGSAAPFEWAVPGDGDLAARIEGDGSARRLVVASSSPFTRPVLQQLVPLVSGRWRASWRADGAGSRTVAALSCQPDRAEWVGSTGNGAERTADMTTPEGCLAPWLLIGLDTGSGEVRLGAIRLTRLP